MGRAAAAMLAISWMATPVARAQPTSPQPASAAHPTSARKGCRLLITPGGQLDAQLAHHRILVPITINGNQAQAILDTGAATSLIFGDAARRLGLGAVTAPGVTFYGAGGASQGRLAVVTFGFAGTTTRGLRINVAGERAFDADMLLGMDLLSAFNLELDLAHGLVRIVQPVDCADDQMAYWAEGYSQARIQSDSPGLGGQHVVLQVTMNGRPLRAILDTGAPVSIATLATAHRAHVPLSSGEGAGRFRGGGIGASTYTEQVAPMQSFEVGGEQINNTTLRFANLFGAATREETGSLLPRQVAGLDDMLLGYDFIAAHHLLISPSHHVVLFTYNGGAVFDAPKLARPTPAPPKEAAAASPPQRAGGDGGRPGATALGG